MDAFLETIVLNMIPEHILFVMDIFDWLGGNFWAQKDLSSSKSHLNGIRVCSRNRYRQKTEEVTSLKRLIIVIGFRFADTTDSIAYS